MNTLKKIVFLILFSFLLSSCGAITKSVANKKLTEEKGAIPVEFGKDDTTTMIFITHHRSYNKYLKKNVKKIYKGKYEFVTESEFLEDEKYKNTDIYRFIFDYNYQSAGYNYSKQRDYLYSVKKFSILDRKTEKLYKSPMTSSYWSKLQKVYLQKLNEKLISEQN
ncbi:hypothetical protein [Aquimarina aggregata]|uniref:hypothetical protein n=1 Tax=Aquimarina aggregata TaxID=1642818 RepID=UPI0024901814|nr:hypothetical protein [Aquimarina aggregata]